MGVQNNLSNPLRHCCLVHKSDFLKVQVYIYHGKFKNNPAIKINGASFNILDIVSV